MASGPFIAPDVTVVPLFPLPNVVLFPGAVLPLHIFEERYKAMTADVLRRDGRLAMALLRHGWEKNYYQHPAIEPVVCVGQILSHEKLADGRYNFLLEGTARARIIREITGQPYRLAELELMRETPAMEVDLEHHRLKFLELFQAEAVASTSIGCQLRKLVRGSLPTARVADICAFNLIEDIPLRQQLLAETDVHRRVDRICQAVKAAVSGLSLREACAPSPPGLN